MRNNNPVSDSRNYKAVSGQVTNGREDYAIADMKGLDELQALNSLLFELEKGEASARKDGWISLDDAEKETGTRLKNS